MPTSASSPEAHTDFIAGTLMNKGAATAPRLRLGWESDVCAKRHSASHPFHAQSPGQFGQLGPVGVFERNALG